MTTFLKIAGFFWLIVGLGSIYLAETTDVYSIIMHAPNFAAIVLQAQQTNALLGAMAIIEATICLIGSALAKRSNPPSD